MTVKKSLYNHILGPYRISHHPLCKNFKEHVFIIREHKVCRGCVMQYSGILLALVFLICGTYLGWWFRLNEIQIGLILYLLIIPTFFNSFLIKNRLLKDFTRLFLGIAFLIAIVLMIFTPILLIKLWILINFIPGYIYLNKKREKNNLKICSTCNEFQKIPNCEGYQIYSDRESIFLGQQLRGGIIDPFSVSPDLIKSSKGENIKK